MKWIILLCILLLVSCSSLEPEYKTVYSRAIEKWGSEAQVNQAIQECAELIQALTKIKQGRPDYDNIVEEIADVEIMMQELNLIFGIGMIQNKKKEKLERLERIGKR